MAEITLTFANRIEANAFMSQLDRAAEKVEWKMQSTNSTQVIITITNVIEEEKENWE